MDKNNRISVYTASGWFTDCTREILSNLESILDSKEHIDAYSPRRDGIMLPANQKHDTKLRESIFQDNIAHILSADFVLANIDSADSYSDPGTVYEIGYAMANNIPVVGFDLSHNITSRYQGILKGFEYIISSYEELNDFLDTEVKEVFKKSNPILEKKVLFVGAGNQDIDTKLASHIVDSGFQLRWVNEDHDNIYSRIDEIFDNIQYMIAVIDDRKAIVSWMIGQAYARGIPVITYSDFNYGINIMLLISVLTHLRGTEELVQFLQKVKRQGLSSIPPFDVSQMNAM